MKKTYRLFFFLLMGMALLATGDIAAQETPKQPEKNMAPADALLGSWDLQVDAGEEVYFLSLTLQKGEGPLAGTVSEANGWFTDVPLADLTWDGTTLKFTAVTTTPPDGADRPWFTEMKLIENAWAGTVSIPDLGIAIPVSGTKKVKVLPI